MDSITNVTDTDGQQNQNVVAVVDEKPAEPESASKISKPLSVDAPSWRSKSHIDDGNSGRSPVPDFRAFATRKPRGPYTSLTPAVMDSSQTAETVEQHGDDVGRTHRRPTSNLDVLEIKVPFDSQIWKRISARSHRPNTPHSTASHPRILSSNLLTPLAIRNSELGLHFRFSITENGTISIRLRGSISIELTIDNAIRVHDGLNGITAALSNTAALAALIHPNGRLYQYNSRIDIMAMDGLGRNSYVRFAKFWYKGISFANEKSALTYLVDTAGARTTTDHFVKANAFENLVNAVFFENSCHGYEYSEAATKIVTEAQHFMDHETEIFDNRYIRISQNADGHVQIVRTNNKGTLLFNGSKGSVSFTTPQVYCTASLGNSSHLFVKRGDRRLHFNGSTFCVRNAGHSAGFDNHNQFKIFN